MAERVYDEDDEVTVRRGDLRVMLNQAIDSLDFCDLCSWHTTDVEAARKVAELLGTDPIAVTPLAFRFLYVCRPAGHHSWKQGRPDGPWRCEVCGHTSLDWRPPSGVDVLPGGQRES